MNSNRLYKAINTAHIIFWKSLTYHTALRFLVWQWALGKVGIIFWRTATRWWSCTCGVCVFGTTCCHPSSLQQVYKYVDMYRGKYAAFVAYDLSMESMWIIERITGGVCWHSARTHTHIRQCAYLRMWACTHMHTSVPWRAVISSHISVMPNFLKPFQTKWHLHPNPQKQLLKLSLLIKT